MSNRAVCYLRSSKDRSDVSIDAQRRALHDVAIARSLVVVDEFADAVESGKDEDRPAFQRLLRDLKAPGRSWEHVLVLDTSRIARRRTIALLFEQECLKRQVRVSYKNVPDSDPVTEMLLKSILQAMDEWHSLTSRQKGLAGMAENVRQGWRAGGRAPRGYQLEYHATGATRDGSPVTKSRLVMDDALAPEVGAYLRLRAQGIPRGTAIARLQLRWPASSTHSMDWQALTYAGHTVWNMHADQSQSTEKRRPRTEWVIQRNTHPPLISDAEAEAILRQQELSQQGRRMRASPMLLSGLLQTADGAPWHSDGCGHYRLGKGKKVAAHRIDRIVLDRLADDLAGDATVERIRASMLELAGGEPVDGRRLAALEKRIASTTTQIGRTVDLAAHMADPGPVLRRVEDLEAQRTQLVDELGRLRQQKEQAKSAGAIGADEIRSLLRRLVAEIARSADDEARRAEARLALSGVLERVELDATATSVRLHYAVSTGVSVASPRVGELSPLVRWSSDPVALVRRRAA